MLHFEATRPKNRQAIVGISVCFAATNHDLVASVADPKPKFDSLIRSAQTRHSVVRGRVRCAAANQRRGASR